MVTKLDEQGFKEALQISDKPIVVDFSTDWCPYCKRLAPTIEEIAHEYAHKIEVYYVNTDDYPDLAEQYEIMTVPTVFVFLNGEIKGSIVNPRTKEMLLELIFN